MKKRSLRDYIFMTILFMLVVAMTFNVVKVNAATTCVAGHTLSADGKSCSYSSTVTKWKCTSSTIIGYEGTCKCGMGSDSTVIAGTVNCGNSSSCNAACVNADYTHSVSGNCEPINQSVTREFTIDERSSKSCPTGYSYAGIVEATCSGSADILSNDKKTCTYTLNTCDDGTFLDETSNNCETCSPGYYCVGGHEIECPVNYYQDASGASSCIPCPNGKITRGQTGARFSSQCYNDEYHCYKCGNLYSWGLDSVLSARADCEQVANNSSTCNHDDSPSNIKTITANANGGTITATSGWTNASNNKTATKSVTSGSTIGTLPNVTRSGHTLKEWRTKSDGTGDVVTSSTTATANMTIYAIWTENTTTTSYTITANANGGKMEMYGDQTGGADSTTNTAGFILYPNAMPGVEYTITMSSATLTSGSATKFSTRCYDLTSDATLSRKDVSFGSNISYTISCPSTANAEHQLVIPIYYGEAGATAGNHVTFSNIKIAVNTGWTNVSGNLTATKSISSGSTYGAFPIAVRPGYTLKEWNTKSDGTGTKVTSSITATADATIYAIWTKTSPDAPTPPSPTTSYQISFDCNGGTGSMSPMSVSLGQTVTLIANACTRTGFTFTGWAGYIGETPIDGGTYSDGDSFDYTFESDMILKAQWNSNSGTSGTYLIHYDANGGTGTMADTEATVDVTGSLRANAFKYSGHTFDGWRAYYVDSDGNLVPLKDSSNNEVELKNKASFKNLYGPNGEEVTLYAQWKVVNPSTGIFVPTVIIGGLLLISAFGYYLVKKKNVVLE